MATGGREAGSSTAVSADRLDRGGGGTYEVRMIQSRSISRRRFVGAAAQFAAAAAAFPYLATSSKGADRLVVGTGDYQYEVLHDWPKLPEKYSWQTTHNVAVDREGLLYVIHEGREEMKDHPSIFVFDSKGEFVRAFGSQFQGGGHGLEVITEGSEQFLYVTGYQQLKNFAKMTLKGELVWERRAPMSSGLYPDGEAGQPKKEWGRNRFMPTNYAFLPDGGFFLADGYGSYRIHRYDRHGNWVSTFGAEGKGPGQFNTPHGICLDARPGREPMVAVADRANARLQWFTLDGQHRKTMDGFLLPANLDTYKNLLLVPDLQARITLLDAKDNVVAQLGEDAAWRTEVLKDGLKLRREPQRWVAGKFLHPHDACFDAEGNIFVAEWVHTGRITKLRRMA